MREDHEGSRGAGGAGAQRRQRAVARRRLERRRRQREALQPRLLLVLLALSRLLRRRQGRRGEGRMTSTTAADGDPGGARRPDANPTKATKTTLLSPGPTPATLAWYAVAVHTRSEATA